MYSFVHIVDQLIVQVVWKHDKLNFDRFCQLEAQAMKS